MPFLNAEDLEGLIGEQRAKSITKDAGSFERAQRHAAALVTTITGISPPDDPKDAPDWAPMPVAHIILYNLQGKIQGITDTMREQHQAWYDAAIAILKLNRSKAPTGNVGAQTGTMEGLIG